MLAEQQGGVLDEHGVRIVGELGQAHNLETGGRQRLLIARMLSRGLGRVDRHALEVG